MPGRRGKYRREIKPSEEWLGDEITSVKERKAYQPLLVETRESFLRIKFFSIQT